MPLINPILEAQLRRHWQVVVAATVCAVFSAIHVTAFQAAASRYERAIRRATDLGLAVDPTQMPAVTPPRLLVVLAANMLPADAPDVSRAAGEIADAMLEQIAQLTHRHGMQMVSTDPGLTVQEPKAVQVRAHVRVQCQFPQFVAFLNDLSHQSSLISVDRFTMFEGRDGRTVLDLWVTRYVLKQAAPK